MARRARGGEPRAGALTLDRALPSASIGGMDATSLRAALEALPLSDHGDAVFTARLAREQRWSAAHAREVVTEYRRFLELAATCGHRVVPSPAIDAAWHLHLLHTRAYWDGLCAGVLGRPLHHDPDAPGPPLAQTQSDRQRTLAAYRLAFGEPPAAVWDARPAQRRPVAAVLAALAVLGLSGCASGDLGWWFAASLVLMAVAGVAGWVYSALRQDRPSTSRRNRSDGGGGGGGGSGCGVNHGGGDHGHAPAGGTSPAASGIGDGGGGGDGGAGGGCGSGGCGGGGN